MQTTSKIYVLGADPGAKGAVVLLSTAYNPLHIEKDDLIIVPSKMKNGHLDVSYLWNKLYPYKDNLLGAAIEEVHALFGSSASGTFSFGAATGSLHTVLQLLKCNKVSKLPFNIVSVQPKAWQKVCWKSEHLIFRKDTDKLGRKKTDTKATSSNAAHTIFPGVSFVLGKSKKEHDGAVDAALLAYYMLKLVRQD